MNWQTYFQPLKGSSITVKIVDLGKSGEPFSSETTTWIQLDLPDKWVSFIDVLAPDSLPHDIQVRAIRDGQLLNSRRNIVVSGPTNSGKSLLGYLAILSGLTQGRRALLIEPFRALAQEKLEELQSLLPHIEKHLRQNPQIEITTGDYRLVGETLKSPPPSGGEIVIATPERIEAIMRNPDYDDWVSSFGIICVDEAHLIGDKHRGAALEGVMTQFLCEKAPPRFVLLSATLGNCDHIKDWLQPCDIVQSSVRRPPLQQRVIVLENGEKADDIIISNVESTLAEKDASVIVFVYRTGDANRLAEKISKYFYEKNKTPIAKAYHSKMPSIQKITVKSDYETGKIRCLISTTALGAGVNLPATHVFLRDLTFASEGALPIQDILQMMGRAGRGNRSGQANAILKLSDKWGEKELAGQIKSPIMPDLQSVLKVDTAVLSSEVPNTAKLVLGQIVRREYQTISDLQQFFDKSLGGKRIGEQISTSVRWLCDGQRLLAWEKEEGIGATALGRAVTSTCIPLEIGAGFGALMRDVLICDPDDNVLKRWKPLDTLITLELLRPREKGFKRFSQKLPDQIDAWFERHSEKPVLYTEWIRGTAEASKAEEIIGSLGIRLDGKKQRYQNAWKMANLAILRSIVIYQLGRGTLTNDIGRRWGVSGIESIEERWRDHLLWLLAGISEILDIRCFYFTLREECKASDARIESVKGCLKTIRRGVYRLMGLLRFCSPLGPIFRDLEAARSGVGIRTKERLENAGVTGFADIKKMTIDDLRSIGVRQDIANRLKTYVHRRAL